MSDRPEPCQDPTHIPPCVHLTEGELGGYSDFLAEEGYEEALTEYYLTGWSDDEESETNR